MSVTYSTLEHVAAQARPYPTHVLEGCETGLVLFAAAFLGHNDAIHFAEAGVRTTCVDIDGARLDEMVALYPDEWEFATADVWEYAEAAHDVGRTWDILSLDPFTGSAMERVCADLELWTSLATRAVVLGVPTGRVLAERCPDGWRTAGAVLRSSIAAWLVLERDADA